MLKNIPIPTNAELENLDRMQVVISHTDEEKSFNDQQYETADGILKELELLLAGTPKSMGGIEHLLPISKLTMSSDEARPIIIALVRKACINHLAKTLKGRVLRHEIIGE